MDRQTSLLGSVRNAYGAQFCQLATAGGSSPLKGDANGGHEAAYRRRSARGDQGRSRHRHESSPRGRWSSRGRAQCPGSQRPGRPARVGGELTSVFGLSVRWSLADAAPGTADKLREYVVGTSLARFTGMAGLHFKTWRMLE